MSLLKESIHKLLSLCNNSDNKLKINDYEINNSKNEVIFNISKNGLLLDTNDYQIQLYTDFNKYCYINDENNDFNYNILLISKTPDNIMKELLKINFPIIEEIQDEDPYNINYKISIFTKNDIDYDKLYIKLLEKTNISKLTQVPKTLLLSSKQICNIIINEIKKVNYNKEYKHYIDINYDNSSVLMIKLYIKTYTIEFNLILDTYPYLPPILEFISPPIKFELYFALLNLNILQFENWMSSITIDYIIINLTNILEPIFENYIEDSIMNDISKNIINLAYLSKDDSINPLKLFIDIPKISTVENKYWKSGTGYGSSSSTKWDFNKYISEQELLNNKLIECLKKINNDLKNNDIDILSNKTINTYLINYINKQIKGINILELENNIKLYNEIFLILEYFYDVGSKNNKYSDELIIEENIKKIYDEFNVIDLIEDNKKYIKSIINKYMKNYKPNETLILDNYCDIMKKLQFTNTYIIPNYHKFYENNSIKIDTKSKMRIISEISSFKSVLPLNNESTIWCLTSKTNYNIFTFIISGPKDTPYENGLFEFHAYLPPNYPDTIPQVHFQTTGKGKFRFNPNLYDNGKVCLSLIGTWDGHSSEKWNSKTSTFLQVMISIQSLILIEQPYFNEPSYEKDINTNNGILASKQYNDKIYPRTIEYAMIEMIKNPPSGFEEIIKNHFALKKEEIINTVNKWISNSSSSSSINDLQLMSQNLIQLLN